MLCLCISAFPLVFLVFEFGLVVLNISYGGLSIIRAGSDELLIQPPGVHYGYTVE
jgi:hypothetical protein